MIMTKLIISFMFLVVLTGCAQDKLVTEVENADEYIEEENLSNDNISVYFERTAYSEGELDEVFFIVENESSERIEVGDMFFVQKYEDEEWHHIDNHTFDRTDSGVDIAPGESAEFVFWLSVNSIDFEEGLYRLFTRIHYVEQSEEVREQYPTHEGVREDVYLLFELN